MTRLLPALRRASRRLAAAPAFVSAAALAAAALVPVLLSLPAAAQSTACPKPSSFQPAPADLLLAQGKIDQAEILFREAIAKDPHDVRAIADLVRAQLRLDDVRSAGATARSALLDSPKSAALLTALADVQIREGQPWLALETLRSSEAIDPCFARAFLVRSRIDRLDSMYASERSAIARAYALDPADPEIKRFFNQVVTPANDIASSVEYLANTPSITPDLRQSAEASVHDMLPLLSETSQTCRSLPQIAGAVLPLQPSMQDGRHVDGYRLEVGLPKGKVSLGVDTAASGIFLSRAVVEANGFETRAGDPPGTVHADSLQVGPLMLRDCIVGVSDTPFPGKGPGMIGTDLFASYLVTLDFSAGKLELTSLPTVNSVIPGDRTTAPELRGFTPVYHRQQFLLVPVTLNGRERRLFALDSGMRMSTLTLPLAHLVSSTQHGFTNSMKTASGATFQVYRDAFDFEFASLLLRNRRDVLQFDPAAIAQRTGMDIGGLLGFDMLHSAVLQLDYRDGLVKLAFPGGDVDAVIGTQGIASGVAGSAAPLCPQTLPPDLPATATIEARNTGLWDAARMKPGQEITVKLVTGFSLPECRMDVGALLYGHVLTVDKPRPGEQAHLGLAFQRADCQGAGTKDLPLKLVSLVAAPGVYVGLHSQLPTAISGGSGRQISDNIGIIDQGNDPNVNPQAKTVTVHTGTVQGIPSLHLDPQAGASCNALLTSSSPVLHLQPQTKFLLVVPETSAR